MTKLAVERQNRPLFRNDQRRRVYTRRLRSITLRLERHGDHRYLQKWGAVHAWWIGAKFNDRSDGRVCQSSKPACIRGEVRRAVEIEVHLHADRRAFRGKGDGGGHTTRDSVCDESSLAGDGDTTVGGDEPHPFAYWIST